MKIAHMMEQHRKQDFLKLYDTSGDEIKRKMAESAPTTRSSPEEKENGKSNTDTPTREKEESDSKKVSEKDAEGAYDNQTEKADSNSTEVYDIVFCGTEYQYIMTLNSLLTVRAPELKLLHFDGSQEKEQMAHVESAKLVIVFLSPNYIHSQRDVEEFHIALAKHRKMLNGAAMYVIQTAAIPKWPTYFHLVPCKIACQDPMWQMFVKGGKKLPQDLPKIQKETQRKLGTSLKMETLMALSCACDDIISIMREDR